MWGGRLVSGVRSVLNKNLTVVTSRSIQTWTKSLGPIGGREKSGLLRPMFNWSCPAILGLNHINQGSPPGRALHFQSGLIGQNQAPCFQSLVQPASESMSLSDGGRRSHIVWSMMSGQRKTVKTVTRRFYRLNWGMWIHPRIGRTNDLWKKPYHLKQMLKQHVMCSDEQCALLDKMVTRYWKERKYYVDDPYETYHKREEFPATRGLKYSCRRQSRH